MMSEPAADPEWLRLKLESLGVPNAKDVVAAYSAGDQAQLVRALVLREIWVSEIDVWRDKPEQVREMLGPTGRLAFDHLLAGGSDREDIGRLARDVAYATAFGVLYAMTLGTSDSAADDVWDLLEDDVDPTAALWALHESLLSADPSGREGRAPEEP